MKGFVNILKSPGYTSQDVVTIIRSIVSKHYGFKIKAGHLGTLDPGAVGVLPIALSYSTRLFDIMQEKKKKYRAIFHFNRDSETLDSYSEVFRTKEIKINEEDIRKTLKTFIGKQNQIAPKYSSKLINGQRAYDLARKGKDFQIKAKEIEIYEIDFISFKNNELVLDLSVSSGTYIRSICRDLAEKLKTKAVMTSLIRISSGKFNVSNSLTIEEFKENIEENILDIEDYLDFEKIILDNDEIYLLNTIGNIRKEKNDNKYLLKDINNNIFAIGIIKNNILKKDIVLWDTLKR